MVLAIIGYILYILWDCVGSTGELYLRGIIYVRRDHLKNVDKEVEGTSSRRQTLLYSLWFSMGGLALASKIRFIL